MAFVIYIICILSLVGLTGYVMYLIFGTNELTIQKSVYNLLFCVFGIIFVHVVIFCYKVFRMRFPIYLNIYILLAVTLFAFSSVFRFFDNIIYLDKTLHTISGAMITVVGFSIGYMFFKRERYSEISPLFIAIFAFSFSLAIGALWEIFEFAIDFTMNQNMQRWRDNPMGWGGRGSGLVDTMMDLILHTGAALIIAIAFGLWMKKYPADERILITKFNRNETNKSIES